MRRLLSAILLIPALLTAPAAAQVLTLTRVPACGAGPVGSPADLNVEGTVTGIGAASQYRVAAYVFTDQWWTKPTFAAPTAPLTPSGPGSAVFSIDVTTHPNDLEAGYIAIFLVPSTSTPPQASGLNALPASLFAYPYVTAARSCDHRVISWKGRDWQVKDSGNAKWGPGPNYFTDDASNVWIDGAGDLHLKINRVGNRWRSAEVIDRSANPGLSTPGYGTYTFQVKSRVDNLDANAVLGLFTWDDDPASDVYAHREIDFEAARWGNPNDPTNAQFVVQPWNASPEHLLRITLPPGDIATTHRFTWQPGRVDFMSWTGNSAEPGSPFDIIASHTYEGTDVPPAGGTEHIHLNLWLLNGSPPLGNQEVEVVIRDVSFQPLGSASAIQDPTRTIRDVSLRAAPNPTNGPVTFTLVSKSRAPMELNIMDLQGRLVRSLGAGEGATARFRWDGRDAFGRLVAPGMYYAVANGGGVSAVRNVLVIR